MDKGDGLLVNRILVTNDDGIEAEGLRHLETVAARLAHEVWTVAPAVDQSGVSHSISIHHPLRLVERGRQRWSVNGTPSDCVVMALAHVMRETPPDLVLSGVNRGANLGDAVMYSGTASAAITAMMLGVPALALSQQFVWPEEPPWETTLAYAPRLLRALVGDGFRREIVLNINFPAVPPEQVTGVEVTRQGLGSIPFIEVEKRIDRRGVPYFWLGFVRHDTEHPEDADISVTRRHAISVTPLKIDRTAEEARAALAGRLAAALRLPVAVSDAPPAEPELEAPARD